MEQSEHIADSRKLIESHFASVVPLERRRAVLDADAELSQRREALVKALANIDAVLISYENSSDQGIETLLVTQTTQAVENRFEEIDERLSYLQELHTLEKENTAREESITELTDLRETCRAKLHETRSRHDELPQHITQAQQDLDQARLVADTLPIIDHQLDELNAKIQIAAQAESTFAQLEEAETTHQELLATFEKRNAAYSDINTRWVASQAAILSQQLAADTPARCAAR